MSSWIFALLCLAAGAGLFCLFRLGFRRPRLHRAQKKEGRFRISAIIPIHNDVRDLPALLADLQNQTVMPVDILCVDLHSTDGSAELAEKLGAQVYRADSALLRQAGSSGGNGGKCRLFNRRYAFPLLFERAKRPDHH